jgi:hypothetical protein
MDIAEVMQEIADRLDTIDGLRVHAYPPDTVSAPAAVVTYPGTYNFDQTYGRGMDRMPDMSVVALVGKVSGKSTRDRVSEYASGSGEKSFKAVLESGTYETFDVITVVAVEFDIIAMGAVEYLAATFQLDIAGQGAS